MGILCRCAAGCEDGLGGRRNEGVEGRGGRKGRMMEHLSEAHRAGKRRAAIIFGSGSNSKKKCEIEFIRAII